ncbi:MAG: type II secretion system F family protein [Dehalococcoidia bacterium]
MPYKYTAYDENDNIVKGKIEAADESQAEQALANVGYTPITVKWTRPLPSLEEAFPSLYGIKTDDVINFSRQLATLLEAGLTLPQGLKLLEMQVESKSFRKVVTGIRSELEGGSSFSQALAKYPNAFTDIYVHTAAAGEQSGDLAMAMRQAVDYIERGQAAIKKAKRAMVYPSFIIGVGIVVVILLVSFVLPELMGMFDKMDAELPLPTKILMAVSDAFSENVMIIIPALIGVAIGGVAYFKTKSGTELKDRIVLRLPLLGNIVLLSNMALFTRTASSLLKAGVSLPRIMDIVAQTATNGVIRDSLKEVHEALVQGQGLSKPMALNTQIFPPLLTQMITVGEQTGTLDQSMENVANFYDAEVNNKVDGLTAIIEPVAVAGIAIVVGFIAISVITPMYEVMGTVGD